MKTNEKKIFHSVFQYQTRNKIFVLKTGTAFKSVKGVAYRKQPPVTLLESNIFWGKMLEKCCFFCKSFSWKSWIIAFVVFLEILMLILLFNLTYLKMTSISKGYILLTIIHYIPRNYSFCYDILKSNYYKVKKTVVQTCSIIWLLLAKASTFTM